MGGGIFSRVSLLCDVSLQVHYSDYWVWLLDLSTGYTVRGTYTLLTDNDTSYKVVDPDSIWKRHISLMVSLFIWRLLRDRVPTKDNLYKRDIISVEDQLCISGCGQLESIGHLLLAPVWRLPLGRHCYSLPLWYVRPFKQFGYYLGISKSWMVIIWCACIWIIWKEGTP